MGTVIKVYTHGDVILRVHAMLPPNVKRVASRPLAIGEVAGHAHMLTRDSDVEYYEDKNGVLWLRVGPGGASVTHEEHGLGVLSPGEIIEVGRAQEYDHFAEEARQVRD